MAKPTKDAEWATGASDILEPTLGQKQLGWVTGTKPPNGWFNWWMNLMHLWIVWLDSKLYDGTSGDRLGVKGLDSNPTASGHSGVTATGAANASGVAGYGGSNATGVFGEGDSAAPGVTGNSDTAGIGPGVRGTATTGGGVGVEAIGDATNPPVAAAFYIVPQAAAPTTGRVGEMYASTAGILFICTNSVGPVWEKVGLQS